MLVEHPDLDGAVIYESVGRMPHGKLAIADGAISITEKEAIKTRKRSAQPYASVKEKRLERENERLQKENGALREVQRVLRALVAKGAFDYDALAQETATNLGTSESEVGLAKDHGSVGQNEANKGKSNGAGEHSHEDDDDYYNDGEDYGIEDNDYGNNDSEDHVCEGEDPISYDGEDNHYKGSFLIDHDCDLW